MSIPDPPNYRTEVDRVLIKCDANEFAISRTEFWNASNQLVRVVDADPTAVLNFSVFQQVSPFGALSDIFCPRSYSGLGIRFVKTNDNIIVAEVFDGSPAAKAGVLANDAITNINGEPVGGFTTQEVNEKIRGQSNTNVLLKIVRKGQKDPIELSILRGPIQLKPTEQGALK